MSQQSAEVKPYGTSDAQVPKEVTVKTTTRPQRQQVNLDVLKNPLTATLLGMTLGLLLLSVSHMRPFSGWWPWGSTSTSNLPSQKEMETRARETIDDVKGKAKEMYESGSVLEQMKDKASQLFGMGTPEEPKDTLEQARDKATGMYNNVKERVQATGEQVYNTVTGGSGSPGYSMESGLNAAQRAACNTADKARDIACNPSKYSNTVKHSMENTRQQAMDTANQAMDAASETGENVKNSAAGIYENAKQKAAEMLEAAKNTMTYPLHKAQETGEAVVDSAREQAESVRAGAENTVERAKERVQATGDAARGAGEYVKDTVMGAGERVKDTVLGAGERVKEAAESVLHRGSKETTTTTGDNVNVKDRSGHAKVKVEVQDL